MAVTSTTAIVLLAASAAISAAGAISQGRAAAKQASLQAEIQRQQAERERQEAALREVIVNTVFDASETTTRTAAEVARSHDELDRKSANRIYADIEGSLVALIANLEAMQ